MSNLKENQILLTLSKDGKNVTVQIGDLPKRTYSSCTKKPYEDLQNSISAYIKNLEVPKRIELFNSQGCWYDSDGLCRDCN